MRGQRWIVLTGALVLIAVAAVLAVVLTSGDDGEEKQARTQAATKRQPLPAVARRGGYLGGGVNLGVAPKRGASPSAVDAGEGASLSGGEEASLTQMLLAQYQLRAYPRNKISFEQSARARRAFAQLPRPLSANAGGVPGRWQLIGPTAAKALAHQFTPYPVRPAFTSGRVISIAVAPKCVPGNCRLFLGTAGGGVWRTDDALAAKPAWTPASNGITSSGIGSLLVDPHDASGRTVYAGTGELRSGSDATAGVGLFKTTDGGDSWSLVPGSEAIARDRAITGIVIDPRDAKTFYISTGPTLRGASSVAGGRVVPPTGTTFGLYKTTDGGATFSLVYSSQFPGTTQSRPLLQVALDPNDPDTVYTSALGLGIVRSSPKLDGDTTFRRIFAVATQGFGDNNQQARFAVADLGSTTRIYVGDADPDVQVGEGDFDNGVAHFFRTDNARVKASALSQGNRNTRAWKQLSSANPALPGYESYRYCSWGCWYSNYVASPPGQPNVVFLGNVINYNEMGPGTSNGKAVIRSTDAGVTFTDMTNDARVPPFALHPDQHVVAFSPTNPNIAFFGHDGGLSRTSGTYVNNQVHCNGRGLKPADLKRCKRLLKSVPSRIFDMNEGLATLQFQSVSISANEDGAEVLGGTQDNGTWAYHPQKGWSNVRGGDGGQSIVDVERPNVRVHTYYGAAVFINFDGNNPDTWLPIFAPLVQSGESYSFYMPLIGDPVTGGTMFAGLQHVWRATNYAGGKARLEQHCSFNVEVVCGNWKRLGRDLTGEFFGADRGGEFVVAVERAPGDEATLWAATLPGRVFVAKNADGAASTTQFKRIDLRSGGGKKGTPGRFVSGIAIDPKDPNHAWVSYSGYDAHTPADLPGHVFEVRYNPAAGTATWTNVTYNLGDQPVMDVAVDPAKGDLYAASDFGVMRLPAGAKEWTQAAQGLPYVTVFGLTMSKAGRTLYAATHGRGAWQLKLG